MAPPALPRLCLLPSMPPSCSGRGLACSPRPPRPATTLPLSPSAYSCRGPSSPRAGIGGSPAWRVAAERRGARTAGRSSSERTAWWTTWTGTSTTCPSSMTPSGTPILLGYLQGPCSKYNKIWSFSLKLGLLLMFAFAIDDVNSIKYPIAFSPSLDKSISR